MLSEKKIEIYVRYPERLTGDEVRYIEEILQADDELALLADWYSRFYSIADDPEGPTPEKPISIELEPAWYPETRNRNTFVLSAQTKRQKRGIESVKTFVSERYRTLMRVLYDKEKKMTRIHVVSDYVDEKDIVLLYIPEEDLHLVSRPGGKLEVPEEQVDKKRVEDWSACRILLPVLRAQIRQRHTDGDRFIAADAGGETETIEIRQGEGTVEIICDMEEGLAKPEILLLRTEADATLWRIKNGRAEVPEEKFKNHDLSLFMYHLT